MTGDRGAQRERDHRASLLLLSIASACLMALCGCRTATLTDTGGGGVTVSSVEPGHCVPGQAGCPCDGSNASMACGELTSRSGNYVTCSMGQASCVNGQWSPCEGAHLVTKSLAGATLGGGGLHLLSSTVACHDPCDPNCAELSEFDGGDVDGAGGVISTEAGATLATLSCAGLGCQTPPTCQITQWFQVDMVTPQTFMEITMDATGSPDDFPRGYQVLTSNDGVTWGSPIAMGFGTSTIVTVTFPPQTARYVRIVQTSSTASLPDQWWWSIYEFNVYSGTVAAPVALPTTGWVASASESESGPYPALLSAAKAIDGLIASRWSTGDAQHPGSTTLAGVVHDPGGINPVYDALVYVPAVPALPALASGASCDACPDPASLNAVVLGRTGPDGAFVLSGVPTTNPNGMPVVQVPLVVQAGKWRREVLLTSVPACDVTTVDTNDSRLPQTSIEGDIPKMAIATGQHDPLECLLLKMGVAPSEFQLPGGPRRIDYYVANGADFGTTPAPPESQLFASPGTLSSYDAILLPCEGQADVNASTDASQFAAYANGGGRVLTTHYSYSWLAAPTNPFYGVATWALSSPTPPSGVAAVDTVFAGTQYFATGQALSLWLTNVGASATPDQLPVNPAFHDVASIAAPTVEWIHDNASPNEPLLMSFDTPFAAGGARGTCGRVIHSELHASAAANVTPGQTFPTSCIGGSMTPEEQALEFAILGLTDCISPDNVAPPLPQAGPSASAASFAEELVSSCPSGTHVIWRELDWLASVPASASIVFSVQTANRGVDGGAPNWADAPSVVLANVLTGTAFPGVPDFAPIDVGALGDAGATGALNLANPPIASGDDLLLTVTLYPTSDGTAGPTLSFWQVKSDCAASE